MWARVCSRWGKKNTNSCVKQTHSLIRALFLGWISVHRPCLILRGAPLKTKTGGSDSWSVNNIHLLLDFNFQIFPNNIYNERTGSGLFVKRFERKKDLTAGSSCLHGLPSLAILSKLKKKKKGGKKPCLSCSKKTRLWNNNSWRSFYYSEIWRISFK